jgi:translation initiation factor 2 subunit 2
MTEEILLNRFYQVLGENGIKGKIVMPRPVSSIKNKKTFLENYMDIKGKIEKEHVSSFIDFLKSELSVDASVNGENQLCISGIFRNPSFEKLIKDYCVQFVQCKSCKSGNTLTIKEKKIVFLQCQSCKSKIAL